VSSTRELHPALLEVVKPRKRLVTSYGRPVNPMFSLAEVLWILNGFDDVASLKYYNSKIGDYSDDGVKFNAAYGNRLRHEHGHDQIEDVIQTLLADSNSRQAVLSIWLPRKDRGFAPAPALDSTAEPKYVQAPHMTKDRACNVVSHLMIRDGRLDWMQMMRSNDIMWGTPNNFMQWLHLMEFIATQVGVKMGTYFHIADSLHMYDYHNADAEKVRHFDLYDELGQKHKKMGPLGATYDAAAYMSASLEAISSIPPIESHKHPLLREIRSKCGDYWLEVAKLACAWRAYKENQDDLAADILVSMKDQVLALAQARYFYYWRWNQPGHHGTIAKILTAQAGNERITNWLTDMVAPQK
jgi:thymidylate synthase